MQVTAGSYLILTGPQRRQTILASKYNYTSTSYIVFLLESEVSSLNYLSFLSILSF
jgi:hypothetical protein